MPTLLDALKNGADSDDILRWINEHPDEINKCDESGVFPLYLAAAYGREDIVERLLYAGANKEQVISTGATPLFVATSYGHSEVVQALLAAGVDATFTGFDDAQTPLFIAVENGDLETVQALLAVGAEESAVFDGTLLYLAVSNRDLRVVQVLLAAGADRVDGVASLCLAVINGYLRIVEVLLAAGIDRDAGADGETPLCLAAKNGYLEIARALLDAGADINLTSDGGTPLEQAVFGDDKETVKLLLAHHPKMTCKGFARLIDKAFSDDVKETLQECIDERMKLAGEAGLLDGWPKSATDTPIIHPSEDETIANRQMINEKLDILEHLYQVFGASYKLSHIKAALAVIPSGVKEIILKDDFHLNRKAEIVSRQITQEIEAILGQPILHSTLEINGIKPLFTVNEANLSTIVAKLESENTGESLLASALLLLGYIDNDVNDRVREAEQCYQTQRTVSAIDFLDKAAKIAPRYTEIIRHLLWELKVIADDNPCVRARLAPYDVKPFPVPAGYGSFFRADSKATLSSAPRPISTPPDVQSKRDLFAMDIKLS